MHPIHTLGYEGASIDEVLRALQDTGVELLLDIREAPISRKKFFNKRLLRDTLQEAGLDYHHERRIGTPKWLRDRVKVDRDYAAFFRDYHAHLAAQQQALRELLACIGSRRAALLCYERDPHTCHRLAVAEVLIRDFGLPGVVHLYTPEHSSPRR